jgi:hypothetical protein
MRMQAMDEIYAECATRAERCALFEELELEPLLAKQLARCKSPKAALNKLEKQLSEEERKEFDAALVCRGAQILGRWGGAVRMGEGTRLLLVQRHLLTAFVGCTQLLLSLEPTVPQVHNRSHTLLAPPSSPTNPPPTTTPSGRGSMRLHGAAKFWQEHTTAEARGKVLKSWGVCKQLRSALKVCANAKAAVDTLKAWENKQQAEVAAIHLRSLGASVLGELGVWRAGYRLFEEGRGWACM